MKPREQILVPEVDGDSLRKGFHSAMGAPVRSPQFHPREMLKENPSMPD
jgi:hypothetical protein